MGIYLQNQSTSSMVPDKRLIKLRFEQAAVTYEQQATIQMLVADRLLALLAAAAPGDQPTTGLEIGCCTGLLTGKLVDRLPSLTDVTVSDLVPAFSPWVRQKIGDQVSNLSFLAGDIETLGLPRQYDLIISSSTLHWVHDLPALVRKLRDHLHARGVLAVSVYGIDNLREIRTVTGLGLQYRDLKQLTGVFARDFEILASDESRETLWFPDPISVLRHLRATGVNALGQRPWSRRELRAFHREYTDRFSGLHGVRLTYHPMYLIGRPRC
ncbi:malonyl-ACP O-methyltransferase BioC [Desulfobulbus alkaliphilus]|uniref:malonyl-ACP O-methyltransferase BioC n=1 Tax=Desulfobulbus alkaliphilus TaxID=869814 RepID=UPI0019657B51|nr:malonyl-ACP O-methyltransferase BioC [Desulfobulbus alkaliphilus]MBM9536698.1 malonyl-ACP O-methyltransferase BioC [Desulfobulbus alkaliphilus]